MAADTKKTASGWSPLRHATFRTMWTAQFASNIGSWMQTVGAQWLMLSLTSSAAYLAFIQSAASLPVLLFAIPAGAIGDLVDRRRLLLAAETFMLVASVALGVLAERGLVTPWVLLALVFAVGSGQAWVSPTWQTLQPELVPPPERPQAIALGAVNQNLARAVGPAIGGVVVAATSPSTTFLINAATFLAVILAVFRWHGTRAVTDSTLPREHVISAIRAAGRFVDNSPALRTVLMRSAAFIFFASALWALLPAVAAGPLGLGSGGYGLLLAAVGVGAVGGAFALPRLRTQLSADQILAIGSLVLAAATLVLATVHVAVIAALALVFAGVGWILSLAILNSVYQAMLPGWVKARGMAFYLIVFQGGSAIGSAVIGLAAGSLGVTEVLAGTAVALAATPLLGLRRPMPHIQPSELVPVGDWPAPQLAPGTRTDGPVMVTIERHAAPGQLQALTDAVLELRFGRRRAGASAWTAWSDAADPARVIEQFVVATWDDHLRFHERVTVRDQQRLDLAESYTDPDRPQQVTHWVQIKASGARDLAGPEAVGAPADVGSQVSPTGAS